MWTNYCIRTIEIVTINLCFFWCKSTLIRNVITKVETIASSHKNNSVWFSKIITLNSFWTRTKKLLALQVVHSYLQRGTSSIKQLLLGQITGWSIERFAALSTSQSQTTFLAGLVYKLDIWEATLEVVVSLVSSRVQPCPGDNSLLSEKRQLTFVLSKEPIQSPPG